MIPAQTQIDMLTARLSQDDETLAAVEAVLLRAAFERLDDFLHWLDEHTTSTHTADPSATAVVQMIGGVRHKLARELATVDIALERIES